MKRVHSKPRSPFPGVLFVAGLLALGQQPAGSGAGLAPSLLTVDGPSSFDPTTVESPVWNESARLLGSDTAFSDLFGISVSVSGNTAVVGAPFDDDGAWGAGSAYVFVRSGRSWIQEAKLTASDPEADAQFGHSVSISGDTILVGAPRVGSVDEGAVYVFVRNGTSWSEQAKLTAHDGAVNDFFGSSVSVSDDIAVVGAPEDDVAPYGFQVGSAYLFVRRGTSWKALEDSKLLASDRQSGDHFGYSVSISGSTLLVGAYGESEGGYGAGAAYVFVRNGPLFVEEAKLIASDAGEGRLFGWSVSVTGDAALIGAPDDFEGLLTGSAYVFTRSGTSWSEQARLTASDGAANDNFGSSVCISSNTAVVGAIFADAGAINAGAAYVFERSGASWSERAKLVASDPANDSEFGAVSITGETAVVGAWKADAAGGQSGAAYAFSWGMAPKVRLTTGPPLPAGTVPAPRAVQAASVSWPGFDGQSLQGRELSIDTGEWRVRLDCGARAGVAFLFLGPPLPEGITSVAGGWLLDPRRAVLARTAVVSAGDLVLEVGLPTEWISGALPIVLQGLVIGPRGPTPSNALELTFEESRAPSAVEDLEPVRERDLDVSP